MKAAEGGEEQSQHDWREFGSPCRIDKQTEPAAQGECSLSAFYILDSAQWLLKYVLPKFGGALETQ